VGFLSQSKTWHSDHPHTLRPTFLDDFLGILQVILGLIGIQGMGISSLEVGVTCTYMNENEEQPGEFAGTIFKQ